MMFIRVLYLIHQLIFIEDQLQCTIQVCELFVNLFLIYSKMPPKSVANKKSNPQPEQKKANKG